MDEENINIIKEFLELMSEFDDSSNTLKELQSKNITKSSDILNKDIDKLEYLINLQTEIIDLFINNHDNLINIMQIQIDLIEVLGNKELFLLYVNFVKALEIEDYIECDKIKKEIIKYEKDKS